MSKSTPVTKRAFIGLVGMRLEPAHQDHFTKTEGPAPETDPHSSVKPRDLIPAEAVYCLAHAKRQPCPTCVRDELRTREHFERRELLERFNASNVRPEVAKAPAVLAPADAAERAALARNYNVDKYRKEINLALKHARTQLKGFPTSWQDSNDLTQEVDIEIWKATLHYKDRMNYKIAYTIARNQAAKFLKHQRNEQTVAVKTPEGPVLDEFGQPKRINRFESFDERGTDDDGEPSDLSPVERRIVASELPTAVNPRLDNLVRNLPDLQRLVSGWYGAKRIVGEVLLKTPDATVRDFPGIPKSTAARVRKVVLAEFRALVDRVGQNKQTATY